MTRLIDADRLKAHVKMQTDLLRNFSSISELGELATIMADGFEREVDIQPTVDAVPVEWIKKYMSRCLAIEQDAIGEMVKEWAERKEE